MEGFAVLVPVVAYLWLAGVAGLYCIVVAPNMPVQGPDRLDRLIMWSWPVSVPWLLLWSRADNEHRLPDDYDDVSRFRPEGDKEAGDE